MEGGLFCRQMVDAAGGEGCSFCRSMVEAAGEDGRWSVLQADSTCCRWRRMFF